MSLLNHYYENLADEDNELEPYTEKSLPDEAVVGRDLKRQDRSFNTFNDTTTDNSIQHFGSGIYPENDGWFCFGEIRVDYKQNKKVFSKSKSFHVTDPYCEMLVRRQMDRFVYPCLKDRQYKVLRMIIDRTIGWKKLGEKIRKCHFSQGVYEYSCGTGLHRTNVDLALQELKTMGFIYLTDKDTYYVDFNTINDWLISKGVGFVLRDSKQGKDKSKKCSEKLQIDEKKCSEKLHSNIQNNNNNVSLALPSVTQHAQNPLQDVQTDINKKMSILDQRKKVKEESQKDKPMNMNQYEKFWNDKVKEQYTDSVYMYWTVRQKAMVKQFVNKVEIPKGLDHRDFFMFVIDRWFTIERQHFSWINQYNDDKTKKIQFPEFPQIEFVMSFKKNFLNAFQREVVGEFAPEYYLRKRLKAQGYTEYQIDDIVTQKAKDETKVADKMKSLDAKEESLHYQQVELDRKKRREMRLFATSNKVSEKTEIISQPQESIYRVHSPENPIMDYNQMKLKAEKEKQARENVDLESLQTLANLWLPLNPNSTFDMIFTCLKAIGIEESKKVFKTD